MKTLITEEVNINIEWVGAISVEEYKAGKEFIPMIKEWWWLRSPGFYSSDAACVFGDGSVCAVGFIVFCEDIAVRPALRIGNLKALNLRPGDKVEIAGITWTIISEDLALADSVIAHTAFNHDHTVGNEYVGSDLESYIIRWWRYKVRNH